MIPRVFNIPASAPFLPTLIRALADGALIPGFPGGDALELSRATIYLPTRRACRAAIEHSLDALRCEAAVLPRFAALGEIDEDECVFAADGGAASLELPPGMQALERRLLLARLIIEWAQSPEVRGARGAPLVARTPAAALALADELAHLIDDMTTRQVPWDRLDEIVPDQFDRYWELSLRFLKIARERWPEILAERGYMEGAERRDRLLVTEARRLAETRTGPVIAAGSTGSMPATATLLAAIAGMPNGAVVLPGLDTHLDRDSWNAVAGHVHGSGEDPVPAAVGHPQFAMHWLLRRIGLDREMVVALDELDRPRARLVSEAFRPAATTERWSERLDDSLICQALAGMTVIEAPNAEEEANAIAVVLRECLEVPGSRAALATADRALGRRVAAALGRWNIDFEDSRGTPLSDTSAGIFARLGAEAVLMGLPPVTLLALLKHPLFGLGESANHHAEALATLERAVLRGPAPRPRSSGLSHALAAFRRECASLHPRDPRAGIGDPELDRAADLIDRLTSAIAPLESIAAAPHRLSDLAARHREVILALGSDDGGNRPVFDGDDGRELAEVFDEIIERDRADDLVLTPRDYPDLFRAIIADRYVRGAERSAARVHILGPLEARLQSFDAIILGGLVEGSWPPEARNDPWLSRPMRHALGLDLPERRIGLSAHDFAQCLGAERVVLTRACKLAGAPTIPSRFLQRLKAVAGEVRWSEPLARGQRYVELARVLDHALPAPIEPPAPKPPRAARPKYLTVTDVEHWLRDPYTIYAKHVLKLVPLDAVNVAPGARDRGNLIHNAIADFTQQFAAGLPADPFGELRRLGRERFRSFEDFPEARAFWWPRFMRIAEWFVAWDAARRADLVETRAEIRGEIKIAVPSGEFRLAARADRIDRVTDGRYEILDYKTGEVRTEKQIRAGLAPQLTLEAAILRHGGFAEFPRGASIAALAYVQLKGGDPAGQEICIDFKEGTPDSQADAALARFAALLARFDSQDQPFRSLVHPMWKARYGEYDHLARVKEWSLVAEEANGF